MPDVFAEVSGVAKAADGQTTYHCRILNGHIIVEFPHPFQGEDIDEVFRMTRHLVDNTILTKVVFEGVGLLYTLEACKRHAGEIISATPDRAPKVDDIQVNFRDVFNLMGTEPRLRYAVRDFNQGLINREDCPFFFYRAIETLAKMICNKDRLYSKDWEDFHSKIGTEYHDIKDLREINLSHRHGTHRYFTKEQHLVMLRTINHFLSRSVKFLSRLAS